MVERCRRERVVLAVHDDAELQRAPRLAPLGGGGSGTKGIAAHFGLATARRPLGVFEATMRDDKNESESVRWPLRQGAGNRARLSRHAGRDRVRPGRRRNCCRSRRAPASWCAPVGGGACCAKTTAKKVFGTAEQPTLARRSLNLAACGGKRARKKREVTLDPPASGSYRPATGDAPLSMLAVSVTGPQGWLLLATEGEPEKDNAVRKWYERRWTEYFKALKWASKTGSSTTPTTFESASHAITACRVFDLQRMARNRPDAPAAEVADEDEIVVLDLAERGMVRAPPENLDVQTFVVDVGRLGGFTSAVARGRQDLARLRLRLRSNRRYGTTTYSRT